jgi:hypothetical protein
MNAMVEERSRGDPESVDAVVETPGQSCRFFVYWLEVAICN